MSTNKSILVVYLPAKYKQKAKIMAAQMGISMSHLVEGLIAGVQFEQQERKDENSN